MVHGKLGKKPKKHDLRTLKFGHYVDLTELPPTPPSVNFSTTIGALGVMMNDSLGCCTIAAAGHIVQSWTGANGTPVIVPDPIILQYYENWDGYVEGDPNTDQGGVELDVLKNWRKSGFDGHSLLAFTEINPKNHAHVMASTAFYGGVYGGVELPMTAQGQAEWTVLAGAASSQSDPGSWGGHAVPVVGYSPKGVLVITWGAPLWVSWDFWDAYFTEAYCLISGTDWIGSAAGAMSPTGVDLATLLGDLNQVTA
jgi:hypothetical protein